MVTDIEPASVSLETGDRRNCVDVINLSLAPNTDTVHAIHFLQDGVIQKISMAELDCRSVSVALHLRERGVRPGDRVGIAGKNCLEWVLLDRAVLKLGGITCGFDVGRFVASMAIERYGLNRMFVEEVAENDLRIHG